MSGLQGLRLFVSQRLNAAVEEIFAHFEETILEYEQEIERRHRNPPDSLPTPEVEQRRADNQQLLGEEEEEEVSPEQQESSSSPVQDPPHIKEEEELWSRGKGEQAELTQVPFTPVPVKSEEEEEKLQSSQLHQDWREENVEAEAPGGSSSRPTETEAGGSEATGSFEPMVRLQSETDDSEDWKETREPLRRDQGSKGEACSSGKKQFSCSECSRIFSDKSNLTRHMRVHTGEKPFGCPVCGRRFRQRSDLVAHVRIHTGEKPYPCSVCHTSFTQRNILVQHMRTHTGAKPYVCPVCGKGFSQKGNMTSHMTGHTGEKPFGCTLCDKRFALKGSLKVHMRVHLGERPFMCPVCGKCFAKRGNMMSHMWVHAADRPEAESPDMHRVEVGRPNPS